MGINNLFIFMKGTLLIIKLAMNALFPTKDQKQGKRRPKEDFCFLMLFTSL